MNRSDLITVWIILGQLAAKGAEQHYRVSRDHQPRQHGDHDYAHTDLIAGVLLLLRGARELYQQRAAQALTDCYKTGPLYTRYGNQVVAVRPVPNNRDIL